MSFSGNERLTDLWLPAVRAMRPEDQLLQDKAGRRAVTPDGYIDPIALLPGGTTLEDFDAASNTLPSSDTVNYLAYMTTMIHLLEGVWRVKARCALTGWLSGSSNFNLQLWLNSQASANFQIPVAANDMATNFARFQIDEVSGDVQLATMFRPSAGTLTIEAGEWSYRAERIR